MCGAALHAADFGSINKSMNAYFFGAGPLWQDSPEALQKRLGAKFAETKAGSGRIHSAYVKAKILGADASEVQIKSEGDKISGLKIVFFNKGDSMRGKKWTSAMASKMKADAKAIYDNLTALFDKPKITKAGNASAQTKAYEWDFEGHKFLLLYEDKEFIILEVQPEAAANSGGAKSSDRVRKKNLVKNVETAENGDVFVKVPMVNQGGKGYCFPATIERLFLYMGVEGIDMHKLADMFNTKGGGGTYLSDTLPPLQKLGQSKGLRLDTEGLDFSKIIKRVDAGVPMGWLLFSTSEYNKFKNERTAARKGKDIKEWKKFCSREKKFKTKLDRNTAHICIILGYNKETKEVAVSDSWGGSEEAIFWITFDAAKAVSQAPALLVFQPKN